MKRLVVCCDGTWNRLDAPHPTNVVKAAEAVLPRDAGGTEQIVFYDEGVGTGEGRLPLLDRILGGALGEGLDQNIQDAYRFLVFNYAEGDEIFVFGFSRGAYTARSLCGLIRYCGILHRRFAHLTEEGHRLYRNRTNTADCDACVDFVGRYSRRARIRFLGVWDTVGSLGIPTSRLRAPWIERRYQFHDTQLSDIIDIACHAVAIDERRRAFAPTLWDTSSVDNGQLIEQLWFPGDHGAVGGGGPRRGLSDGAFLWMMQHASRAGLGIDSSHLVPPITDPDPLQPFADGAARRPWIVRMAYRLTGAFIRPAPPSFGHIHLSACARWQKDPAYRPPPLSGYVQAIERTIV